MTVSTAPPSLGKVALERFDQLQKESRLFYGTTSPENLHDSGFEFHFTLIKAFTQKPWEGKASTTAKPDPFGNPEKDFVISSTPSHLLQLNKYNAWRPQFIVHPREYQSQKDHLTLEDLEATSRFLEQLEEDGSEWLTFYNCGPESGSSQPYKHLQVVEKPPRRDILLWPDREDVEAQLRDESPGRPVVPTSSACVPYACALASLGTDRSARTLYNTYQALLNAAGKEIGQKVVAHNMLMTRDWLLVIPRRDAGSPCAANSMGMLGIVWLNGGDEREGWKERGYVKHLQEVGFPASNAGAQ